MQNMNMSQQKQMLFMAAKQMQNYIYLCGDASSRDCYVIDACWDVEGIVAFAKRHKMRLVGAIATHFHFDHAGGKVPPQMAAMVFGPFAGESSLPGLRELKRDHDVPVYAHRVEVPRVADQCSLSQSEVSPLEQSKRLGLGTTGSLEVLHTPGHSGGSICLLVRWHDKPSIVMCGDTIFPGSCGRLDLPDSDVDKMFDSLQQLRLLSDDISCYPGHGYGGAVTTIGREKASGLLRPFTRAQWASMH